MDEKKTLGETLKAFRMQAGITQTELGEKLNISAQAISKWEREESQPDIETLKKLAEIYGVSVAEIIEPENCNGSKKFESNGANSAAPASNMYEGIREINENVSKISETMASNVKAERYDIYTTGSHFMVLAGINEKGLYEVLDPFRPNHARDELLEGFEHGFMEWEIVTGLEGSWVFDKEAMGSFRYDIDMPEPPNIRYVGFRPTDLDRDYLARFVWAAARNESPETQQAVAELVLNRLCHHQFPDLVERVMRQDELYTFYRQMGNAQPGVEEYEAVTNAIYGPHILPLTVLHGAPWLKGAGKEWGQIGSFTFLYTVD